MRPTIVLGASKKPERYSYKAIQSLKMHGHDVVGVHPKLSNVLEAPVYPSLAEAAKSLGEVDTVTMYLGASRSAALTDEILAVRPKRVIFNPGAENEELASALEAANIEVVEACTLVMLSTDQYEG